MKSTFRSVPTLLLAFAIPSLASAGPIGWPQDSESTPQLIRVFDRSGSKAEVKGVVLAKKEAPYMGIQVGGASNNGVTVTGVFPNTGAQEAGLREGDVIVRIGDKKTPSVDKLVSAVNAHEVGDQVAVQFKRGGKDSVLLVSLKSRPDKGDLDPGRADVHRERVTLEDVTEREEVNIDIEELLDSVRAERAKGEVEDGGKLDWRDSKNWNYHGDSHSGDGAIGKMLDSEEIKKHIEESLGQLKLEHSWTLNSGELSKELVEKALKGMHTLETGDGGFQIWTTQAHSGDGGKVHEFNIEEDVEIKSDGKGGHWVFYHHEGHDGTGSGHADHDAHSKHDSSDGWHKLDQTVRSGADHKGEFIEQKWIIQMGDGEDRQIRTFRSSDKDSIKKTEKADRKAKAKAQAKAKKDAKKKSKKQSKKKARSKKSNTEKSSKKGSKKSSKKSSKAQGATCEKCGCACASDGANAKLSTKEEAVKKKAILAKKKAAVAKKKAAFQQQAAKKKAIYAKRLLSSQDLEGKDGQFKWVGAKENADEKTEPMRGRVRMIRADPRRSEVHMPGNEKTLEQVRKELQDMQRQLERLAQKLERMSEQR